jgi:hypothetical protein
MAAFGLGCARPPLDEMNHATEMVTRAENDQDAALYAGNLIIRARDALSRMNAEADSKRYDSAKSYAAEAVAAAERAINEGRAASLRARDEAASLLSELGPLIAQTGQDIDSAKSANMDINFDLIDNNFTEALRTADNAQFALSGSRYQDAISLCNSARSSLDDINRRLSNAAVAVFAETRDK